MTKKCCFQKLKNGKMLCVTHDQAVAYIYSNPSGGYIFLCQIGEDEQAAKGNFPVDINKL